MLRQSIILWIFGCLSFMAGMTHGETVKSPLIFHFSLVHNDGYAKCESESSPGYKVSFSGRTHIAKQSLLCVFLVGPEANEPLPTFCSLLGLDENLSCDVGRRDGFWAVSLSSESHPVGGACSVICQRK